MDMRHGREGWRGGGGYEVTCRLDNGHVRFGRGCGGRGVR